jgi:hypothetical protein
MRGAPVRRLWWHRLSSLCRTIGGGCPNDPQELFRIGSWCYIRWGFDTELQSKDYEYICHSERSAASLRISAALKERFFAALRMTKKVF